MNHFNTYHYFFILLLLLHLDVSATDKKTSGTGIECINHISILGSSNINQFHLVNFNPKISPSSNQPHYSTISKNILIPVHDFTGPNDRLLNDFYNLVKASQYPFIKISLEHFDVANTGEPPGMTKFRTRISIAGVTHQYSIQGQLTSCENSGLTVKGNLKIKLTDFNLTPPEKVFGAVKVNDEVFIKFVFQMDSEEVLTEKITR